MRIVTYNIRAGRGIDNKRSIGRIAEVLRQIDPDIVCLQEVEKRLPPHFFEDQPGILERELGMKSAFQANWKAGAGGFGNAILSLFPFITRAEYVLPNERERKNRLRVPERRGLLKAVIETPSGRIAILNTHWSLDADDRREQAAEVLKHVHNSGHPLILTGDFNALPESEEIESIRAAELQDAGAEANTPTFTADCPTSRIDYIWHTPDVRIRSVTVGDTMASDHRPVLAEIEFGDVPVNG